MAGSAGGNRQGGRILCHGEDLQSRHDKAFDVEAVTKAFFADIANWSFWALKHVRFPKDAPKEEDGRDHVTLIRLITRLIFCWFMKEKGLIPHDLFNERRLADLLVGFAPGKVSKKQSVFYKAILQNLFFATLNTEMNKRGWRRNGRISWPTASLDGSNSEICEEVGLENFFHYGLNAEEIYQMKSHGYNPMTCYNTDPDLKEAIDLISSGFFSKKDPDLFKPLVDSLLRRDEHMVLADYQSYLQCQDRVNMTFKDLKKWTRMSILTVARMGNFSSDRSIREYNEKIWRASPLKIDIESTE